MPNITPLPAGAVSGDVWEHGERVIVAPLVIPGMFSTVLVSGPDWLGAAKIASRTSQAMTGLWAECGHGVGKRPGDRWLRF
jgi:hypothetical protein